MKKIIALGLLLCVVSCKKNGGGARPFLVPAAEVSTVAGDGVGGFMDGNGTAAELFLPMGVAVDTMGNVYIADEGNSCIRKILAAAQVVTIAGNGTPGFVNGDGKMAEFFEPRDIARDAQGNLYVTDNDAIRGARIRMITPVGTVSTLAGFGARGYADGPISSALFSEVDGIAVDAQGNIYVGDTGNHRVRKITPGGVVTTLAGNGLPGSVDGPGPSAEFGYMPSLAVDAQGNVYVAEAYASKIRKITPAGDVSTLAGNGTQGYADGSGTVAAFNQARYVVVDSVGNLYVADQGNNCIRKITPAGMVSTLAGNRTSGSVDGSLATAEFDAPRSEAIDAQGNLYVGQSSFIIGQNGYNFIREITAAGKVLTIAGNGIAGFADGPALMAEFSTPYGMTLDPREGLYVVDFYNSRIRKIQFHGTVTTFAGNGTAGFVDGTGDSAQFNEPIGVAADLFGNVYVADAGNNCIRWISPNALVLTWVGNGTPGFADGHLGNALFDAPFGVAVDAKGNQFVADNVNNRIRKISPAGVVTTVAGTGIAGFVDGPGSSAQFNVPDAVAVDAAGNLYVTDVANNCIRKIDPGGVVSTLAGDGHPGLIDGTGKGAEFKQPNGVAVDGKGNVYVADNANNCIRMISPAGVVTTVAGSFTAGYADGLGSAAMFDHPFGIAIDKHGDLYVGDLGNNRIRKIHFP